MARYAVVTTIDIPAVIYGEGRATPAYPAGSVINVIDLDDPAQWSPPANTRLVESEGMNIGDVQTN